MIISAEIKAKVFKIENKIWINFYMKQNLFLKLTDGIHRE